MSHPTNQTERAAQSSHKNAKWARNQEREIRIQKVMRSWKAMRRKIRVTLAAF